jgi:N-acyl-L-homoserine lactone synthetase
VRQDGYVFRYRIAEAGSPDFDRWLRLRQDVYLETGLITPGEVDGSTGFYVDEYDEYSTHVIASDGGGTDIACSRLIDGGDHRPLQVTDLFGIKTEPRSSETSGVAAVSGYRKSWASLGLYRAMTEIAAERGHEYGYAIVEPPYLASLRRIGYPFEVISESKDVYGFPNVAAVFRRGELLESMRTAEGPYASLVYRYFSEPFDWRLTEDDLAVSVS